MDRTLKSLTNSKLEESLAKYYDLFGELNKQAIVMSLATNGGI